MAKLMLELKVLVINIDEKLKELTEQKAHIQQYKNWKHGDLTEEWVKCNRDIALLTEEKSVYEKEIKIRRQEIGQGFSQQQIEQELAKMPKAREPENSSHSTSTTIFETEEQRIDREFSQMEKQLEQEDSLSSSTRIFETQDQEIERELAQMQKEIDQETQQEKIRDNPNKKPKREGAANILEAKIQKLEKKIDAASIKGESNLIPIRDQLKPARDAVELIRKWEKKPVKTSVEKKLIQVRTDIVNNLLTTVDKQIEQLSQAVSTRPSMK